MGGSEISCVYCREDKVKPVYFGRKPLVELPVAHHWAIQVQNVWYEIHGRAKADIGGPNEVVQQRGATSAHGVTEKQQVGETIENLG